MNLKFTIELCPLGYRSYASVWGFSGDVKPLLEEIGANYRIISEELLDNDYFEVLGFETDEDEHKALFHYGG